MSAGCDRRPTARKLEQLNREQREKINDLDARVDELERFAHDAGRVLENMFVSYSLTPEKEELKVLVDQYRNLFPPVGDTPAF